MTNDGTQTFTWNTADRLTNRGTDTFSYDPLDRLTGSTVSSTARTYSYNGDGLLQSRTQGTATTFLWDPSSTPSRLLVQGSDRIVYGLGPLYVVKADGSTLSLARDGGKSIRAEVNGSGAVTASFRYRAYGAIAQSSGASTPAYLGYAGQLLDPSGTYYMRARWYDPASGRFMTRDPLAGAPTHPIGLNQFGYANGSPTMLTDPTGLCPLTSFQCLSYYALGLMTTPDEADAALLAADEGDFWTSLAGNLDSSVADFVGQFRQGSIWRELPSDIADMTINDALGVSSKVRKLLIDGRFAR